MIKELSVTGQEFARKMYNANGWVAHHNTDLWRFTGAIDGSRLYGLVVVLGFHSICGKIRQR